MRLRKDIRIKFPLGTIQLIKPSEWTLRISKNLASKEKLNKYLFAKYMVYYSQSNYGTEKMFSFGEINSLSYHDIELVLYDLVNSDKELLKETNGGDKYEDPSCAYEAIVSHREKWKEILGSLMIGVSFESAIISVLLNAIEGKSAESDNDRLRRVGPVFKAIYPKISEHLAGRGDANLSALLELCDKGEDFILLWNTVGKNIDKIRSEGLWIPSRYAREISTELVNPRIETFDKRQVEELVLKHLRKEHLEKVMSDWEGCSVLNGHLDILRQSLSAHIQGLFAPAITCFLTQVDYLVLTIAELIGAEHHTRVTNRETLEDIAEFIEQKVIWHLPESKFLPRGADFSKSIYFFQLKTLAEYLRQIVFEDTAKLKKSKDRFNRHGILHGSFMDYPTETNSKKIILLIDDLLSFHGRLPEYLKNAGN